LDWYFPSSRIRIQEMWIWVVIGIMFFTVLLIGMHKADQYERNHARRQYRLKLRRQAYEEVDRINFLYPPD
jgi:hypothetical protein